MRLFVCLVVAAFCAVSAADDIVEGSNASAAEFLLKDAKRLRMKVASIVVLFDEGNVLLARRYNTGTDDGFFSLPMGSIEEGESAVEALAREANEEIGIVVDSASVRLGHTMHRLHHRPDGISFPQVDLFFVVSSYGGVIANCEPDKCDEVEFYPLDELPENMVPFVREALMRIANGEVYSEFGWNGPNTPSSARDIELTS